MSLYLKQYNLNDIKMHEFKNTLNSFVLTQNIQLICMVLICFYKFQEVKKKTMNEYFEGNKIIQEAQKVLYGVF